MSRKKKIISIVGAIAITAALAVAGTYAMLARRTTEITNNFVSSSRLCSSINILENNVTQNTNGSYSLASGTSHGNAYKVVSNTAIAKNPYIDITAKTDIPSYLYVEAVDTVSGKGGVSWEIDSDNWEELSGITGKNNGKVWVYKGTQYSNGDGIIKSGSTNPVNMTGINIIKNGVINVAAQSSTANSADIYVLDQSGNKQPLTLDFHAYLAQASAADTPEHVFTACFGS